jgi:hypothetical protein
MSDFRYTVYKREFPTLMKMVELYDFVNPHEAQAYAMKVLAAAPPYTLVGVWDNEMEQVVKSW